MIEGAESFKIPVKEGGEMSVAVNWNPFIKDSEFVKIRVNDEEVIVPRGAFVRAAMMVASDREQEQMIPVKQTPIRHLSKVVTLRLSRNFKQGETLQIPVNFDIPLNGDSLPIFT